MDFSFTSSIFEPETGAKTSEIRENDWHQALARAIRDPDELIDWLDLPEKYREPARRVSRLFPLLVPHSYLERMAKGNPADPLLAQVLPLEAEEVAAPGFVADPVGDMSARRAPGLLHKYHGRALSFQREPVPSTAGIAFAGIIRMAMNRAGSMIGILLFEVIAADATLSEVILSGGDPLMLTDARLATLCERISQIPHITRLRLHTRLPIVLPERVTSRLIELLLAAGPTPIVVVHANHPREIAGTCASALRRLVRGGITVLNQAVLLRGVNDTVAAQEGLCRALIDLEVMPYYLHQLDRVAGAAHFEVAEEAGIRLIEELRRRLPGYAVPRYVRETAGGEYKDVIAETPLQLSPACVSSPEVVPTDPASVEPLTDQLLGTIPITALHRPRVGGGHD